MRPAPNTRRTGRGPGSEHERENEFVFPLRIDQLGSDISADAMRKLLDAVSDYVFVFNERQEVVFANAALCRALQEDDDQNMLGRRMGEILGCENAYRAAGGCGRSDYCMVCGARKALANAGRDGDENYECRILRHGRDGILDAMDLQVNCVPYSMNGEPHLLMAARDISAQKRRRSLERIFFHDTLNTISGLKGLVGFLREGVCEDMSEMANLAQVHFLFLQEEIVAQYDLYQAEHGDLAVQPGDFDAGELLHQSVEFFNYHSAAVGKSIEARIPDREVMVRTDGKLLRRVLVNMIKNALEASDKGATVRVRLRLFQSDDRPGEAVFEVANSAVIPSDVQPMIFRRAYSTKGEGRGLGTYSMRLLTERYLRGRISFSSSHDAGTVFTVSIPRELF